MFSFSPASPVPYRGAGDHKKHQSKCSKRPAFISLPPSPLPSPASFLHLTAGSKRSASTPPAPLPPVIYRLGWRRLAMTLYNMSSYTTRVLIKKTNWRSVTAGGRVRSFVRGEQPLLCTRELIVSLVVFMVIRHRRSR